MLLQSDVSDAQTKTCLALQIKRWELKAEVLKCVCFLCIFPGASSSVACEEDAGGLPAEPG